MKINSILQKTRGGIFYSRVLLHFQDSSAVDGSLWEESWPLSMKKMWPFPYPSIWKRGGGKWYKKRWLALIHQTNSWTQNLVKGLSFVLHTSLSHIQFLWMGRKDLGFGFLPTSLTRKLNSWLKEKQLETEHCYWIKR